MTAVLKSFKDFYLTIHRQYARQRLSNNKYLLNLGKANKYAHITRMLLPKVAYTG